MKHTFLSIPTCAVLVASVIPTYAYAERWECDIKSKHGNWISPFYAIQKATDKYIVADNVSLHFKKGPAKAHLRKMRNGKSEITWSVRTSTGSQTAKMNYRLLIDTSKGGNARIIGRPDGFPNQFLGAGRCIQKPIDKNFLKSINAAIAKQKKP